MAKTYRDAAIEQMIATVEEAMSGVIDWWGNCRCRWMRRLTVFASKSGRQSIPLNL